MPAPHCSYPSKDPERQCGAPVSRCLEASAATQVPPLSDAWEERPLLPHTRLPGAASPAPIAPFPRASPLPVPSHLHLRPLSPGLAIPGAPSRGNPEGKKEKGGREGRRLPGIFADPSEPPASAKQRLPRPGLARRARISLSSSPLPQPWSHYIPSPSRTTPLPPKSPAPPRASGPAPVRPPHPLGAGSASRLPGGGARDRVAGAPCRRSGGQEAAPMQTPAGPGRPCSWARAEQPAGHRPRPARRGGDASGRLCLRRAPGDPSHSALGRRG